MWASILQIPGYLFFFREIIIFQRSPLTIYNVNIIQACGNQLTFSKIYISQIVTLILMFYEGEK